MRCSRLLETVPNLVSADGEDGYTQELDSLQHIVYTQYSMIFTTTHRDPWIIPDNLAFRAGEAVR